jgi:hypothetical protein
MGARDEESLLGAKFMLLGAVVDNVDHVTLMGSEIHTELSEC